MTGRYDGEWLTAKVDLGKKKKEPIGGKLSDRLSSTVQKPNTALYVANAPPVVHNDFGGVESCGRRGGL